MIQTTMDPMNTQDTATITTVSMTTTLILLINAPLMVLDLSQVLELEKFSLTTQQQLISQRH